MPRLPQLSDIMRAGGYRQAEVTRPEFDRPIGIDFRGAKTTSETGFLILRGTGRRFNILDAG